MGTIVTKIRGKVQGSVFSGNIAGNTLRNKTIPRRSTTVARSAVNNNWKYLSQIWLTLSPTQRLGWQNYATNFTFFNKLGAPVAARKNLVFTTTNLFNTDPNVGNPIMLDAPSFLTPPSATFDGETLDVSSQNVTIGFNAVSDDLYMAVFASPPFRGGKEAIMQSRITRFGGLVTMLAPTPSFSIGTEYFQRYPYTQDGMMVWIAWRRIDPQCFSWSPLEYFLGTFVP